MLNIIDIFFALQLAILAYVFCEVLTKPNYIFAKYLDLLIWINKAGYPWIAYPLGYCSKCFGGQLALWIWFYTNGFEHMNPYVDTYGYITAFLRHILFISTTIYLVLGIENIAKKWN